MSPNLYLVFSEPPADVPPELYDRWYHHHIRENVLVPGFVGAQRFSVEPVMAGQRTAPGTFERATPEGGSFSRLGVYEYEGNIDQLRNHLFERIEAGDTPLPSWFDRIRFMTWTCTPLEERVEPSVYPVRWNPGNDTAEPHTCSRTS
jgi:hypothetical protein